MVVDKSKAIGWVGTGVMGEPICRHLLKAGYKLNIYTRTEEKARQIIDVGATWCHSPKDVAHKSAIVFTMVGHPEEVREVYFSEQGLFAGAQHGSIFIDMGTTPPSLTKEIYDASVKHGVHVVDAPVSGGDVGARNAALSIMAGGEKEIVDSLLPVFNCMAKSITYMGPSGNGQHTKLCNQLVVAGTMIGVCEALVYANESGVDPVELVKAIKPGAAGCWTLENLAPRIIKDDYDPGFMVDHFIKDLGIAVQEAKNLGINLPGLSLAYDLYQKTSQLGHGTSGTQALVLAIKKLNK